VPVVLSVVLFTTLVAIMVVVAVEVAEAAEAKIRDTEDEHLLLG
jgi:hypothetical protein